jgi:tRNA pseudouridine32 synthase/23S rRNA pseudouridine746 synthase
MPEDPNMTISKYHSTVLMPEIEKPYPCVLNFLTKRFPSIDKGIWEARILAGKVLTEKGDPVCLSTSYTPLKRLHYFREVAKEPSIPFTEKIIFCNKDLLVACKPHFLPVIPGGPYVNECLLNRLKQKTGNENLSPINRIDRETAGLVLFSMNPTTRGRYQELFMNRQVEKTYSAVTSYSGELGEKDWTVENRIIQGDPWFTMKVIPGKPNAVSKISMIETRGEKALFKVSLVTGKKHQLRLHLSYLGFPILNDRVYPKLLPEKNLNFKAPLQLLAKKISFKDPLSGRKVSYVSERHLVWQD